MAEIDTTVSTPLSRNNGIIERICSEGWRFQFFQAVWLLERQGGDWEPVGGRGPVSSELLRFRPHVGVEFPATDVRRIKRHVDPESSKAHYQVDVTFLGLYGVATPLPLDYAFDILRSVEPLIDSAGDSSSAQAEKVASAGKPEYGSTPARDFLDILHHRIVSLYYRSWIKYRYPLSLGMEKRDAITSYLLWLIGLFPLLDKETLGVDPVRMIRYSGILTQHPRSAATLENLLCDYWPEIPFKVEEFAGRWVTINRDDLNVFGSMNSSLGMDLTVGERVYDLSGSFTIVMGPVNWKTYVSFLPDTERFAQTCSLVKLYCQDPLAYSIKFKILPGEIPELCLSSGDDASQLGYKSWVRTGEMQDASVTFSAPSSILRGL